MATLLELVQAASDEMALSRPNSVVSARSDETRQVFALINRLGRDLCRQHDWKRLIRQHTITTVDGQKEYPLPDDWKKQIAQTEWDRTNRWPLIGPNNPQDWQSIKSGVVSVGPRIRYRLLGDNVIVDPAPPDGLELVFEYISDAFVTAEDGTKKRSFTADTDTCVFDDSLMIVGTIVKFKQAKGLDVTFELGEFHGLLGACKGQDQSAATVYLSPGGSGVLMNRHSVPDGNWVL